MALGRRSLVWGLLGLVPLALHCSDSTSNHVPVPVPVETAGAGGAAPGGDGSGGGSGMPDGPPKQLGSPCNGSPTLCDKVYSKLSFLGSHLSMASDDSWPTQTQGRSIGEQLRAGGVRVLELEVHDADGVPAVCEGPCGPNNTLLAGVLREIAAFLDGNSTEVLTLVIRSAVSADALVSVFDAQHLTELTHSQAPAKAWPTLQQMIDDNKRLVVFVAAADAAAEPVAMDSAGGAGGAASAPSAGAGAGGTPASAGELPPWLHSLSDWAWETAPDEAADCVIQSDNADTPLAILNHYVPGETATDASLVDAHSAETLAKRLRRCLDERGRVPNFVFVNFAEVGDPLGGLQSFGDLP